MVAPSEKVTVPVGMPAPGAIAATVARKVTDRPWPTGLTEAVRVMALAAGLTVMLTAAEVLAVKLALPRKDAVSACAATPSDVLSMACPAASTDALPSKV